VQLVEDISLALAFLEIVDLLSNLVEFVSRVLRGIEPGKIFEGNSLSEIS